MLGVLLTRELGTTPDNGLCGCGLRARHHRLVLVHRLRGCGGVLSYSLIHTLRETCRVSEVVGSFGNINRDLQVHC